MQPATSLPALISSAAGRLASATTAAEVLDARDAASVAYDAAKKAARLARAKGAHDQLIATAHRAQADALEIEAAAKRRLADEYDAAQERGEVATQNDGRRPVGVPDGNAKPTVADIGLSRKDIHEARALRDAEAADPGIVRRTLDARLAAGEEPSKAAVRRAVADVLPRPVERRAESFGQPPRGEGICRSVRDAICALSGLPPAEEVASYFAGTDHAILVAERLPAVADWIAEFNAAWSRSHD